jgi:hypothetical protein
MDRSNDPSTDRVRDYATALADGIEAALPGWVESSVAGVMAAAGRSVPEAVRAEAVAAGACAKAEVGPRVRALLEADIDEQGTTPLALVRKAAVPYPTEVLRRAGVAAVARDDFATSAFPEDVYGLSPATFADLSPELADAGIAWGAAKAFEHRRRHQP